MKEHDKEATKQRSNPTMTEPPPGIAYFNNASSTALPPFVLASGQRALHSQARHWDAPSQHDARSIRTKSVVCSPSSSTAQATMGPTWPSVPARHSPSPWRLVTICIAPSKFVHAPAVYTLCQARHAPSVGYHACNTHTPHTTQLPVLLSHCIDPLGKLMLVIVGPTSNTQYQEERPCAAFAAI